MAYMKKLTDIHLLSNNFILSIFSNPLLPCVL